MNMPVRSPGGVLAADVATTARELYAALREGRQMPPLSSSPSRLTIEAAYDAVRTMGSYRASDGMRRIGRKLGFTNPEILAKYGIEEPIVGDVFDATVIEAEAGSAEVSLAARPEPRIEPEIVLGFASAPPEDGGAEAIARALSFVAAGFEIVQSIYPDWRFDAADAVAANGLHGCLVIGPRVRSVDPGFADLVRRLPDIAVRLFNGEAEATAGAGRNALGGPLSAAAHLSEIARRRAPVDPIAAGEIVTTGTLTDALPVAAGERWRVEIGDDLLKGLSVTLTG